MTTKRLRLAPLAVVLATAAACGGIASSPEKTTTLTTGTGTSSGTTGDGTNGDGATSSGASSSGTSASGSSSGASTGAVLTIPPGTYPICAESVYSGDGASFFNGGGFQSSGQLVVTQSGQNGTSLTATYTDQNGVTTALGFSPDENATATLSSGAQMPSPVGAMCVQGPGDTGYAAATFDAKAGTLVYEAGTVFVSLEGPLSANAAPCGPQSAEGDVWITCFTGGASPPAPVPASSVTSYYGGAYSCTSQIDVFDATGGKKDYSVGGASGGTLVVTQNGTSMTAAYTGDTFVTGTMDMTLTTGAVATAVADQTLSALCLAPVTTGSPTPTPQGSQPLPVTAGALTWLDDGFTLLFSFSGTRGASSACPGAQTAGTLICTPVEDAGAP